jgi:hypothetical protein
MEMQSMPKATLDELIERARSQHMNRAQLEEQRRSFAYGNSKIENDQITRDSINRQASGLTSHGHAKHAISRKS